MSCVQTRMKKVSDANRSFRIHLFNLYNFILHIHLKLRFNLVEIQCDEENLVASLRERRHDQLGVGGQVLVSVGDAAVHHVQGHIAVVVVVPWDS